MERLKRYLVEIAEYQSRNCTGCYIKRVGCGDSYFCGGFTIALCMSINGKDFDFKKDTK